MNDFHSMYMMCSHPLTFKMNQERKNEQKMEDDDAICNTSDWWRQFCSGKDFEKIDHSSKLVLLMAILNECENRDEKIVIFSQSRNSLNVIEHFLKSLRGYIFETDYYMIHGETSIAKRTDYCKQFNEHANKKARCVFFTLIHYFYKIY